MKSMLVIGVLAAIALASGCGTSEPRGEVSSYEPGQVWKYKTRPGEPDSRITILKVDNESDGAITVHIRIDEVHIRNPHAPTGTNSFLPHAPIEKSALDRSVISLERTIAKLPDYTEGYQSWKDNQGGDFSVTVAEILDIVEVALDQ